MKIFVNLNERYSKNYFSNNKNLSSYDKCFNVVDVQPLGLFLYITGMAILLC